MTADYRRFARMAIVALAGWGGLVLVLDAVGDPPLLADSSDGWFTSSWFEDWGLLFGLAVWASFLAQLLSSGLVEYWRLRLRGRTAPATVESVSIVEYDQVRHLETITALVRLTLPDGTIQRVGVDCMRPPRIGQVLSVRYLPDKPSVIERRGRSVFEVAGLVVVESMLMQMLAGSVGFVATLLVLQLF